MRKFLIVCLILFFGGGFVYSAPQKYDNIDVIEEQSNSEEDLLDPSNSEIQSNGSDIKPDKVYTQAEYQEIYRELEYPTFSFIHDVDPDQYYDMKDAAWSPYPLMRLNSPLYFKSVTILPGYYLLTPRQYKGNWYILFKEAGKVKYIIPVFEKNYASPTYYHTHLKELYMKKSQRWVVKFINGVGKYFKRSKRRPAVQTNIELTDLDNNFLLLELYYGPMRYKTIFRTAKF